MTRIIIGFLGGMAAGFAVSFLPLGSDRGQSIDADTGQAVAAVECRCDVQPGADFERALQDERDANARLRAEVARLRANLDRASNERWPEERDAPDWLDAAIADLAADGESPDERQALIDAGFAAARAEWLLDRIGTLQMEALQRNYRAPDAAGAMDYLASRLAGRRALRNELGDFEYEQYLSATGQSTTIAVTGILADSPARQAGLEVGDEIVDYAGVRVFNMIELSEMARGGDPAASVVVTIRRDGIPMQMVLPGGALGITGGRLPGR